MKKRLYKKGERVNNTPLVEVAGKDFTEYENYGIRSEVFDCGDHYEIPVIKADKTGTGKLEIYLKELKSELDKPFIFTTVINFSLAKKLSKLKIPFTV